MDANGGLFETILGEEDAILSDELNHASIIDGVRLCKAQRFRYKHSDMADLEAQPEGGEGLPAPADRHRRRLLDGRRPGAAAGHLRPGRPATTPWSWSTTATPPASSAPAAAARAEELGVLDRIDIITSTLGKTLGGAAAASPAAQPEVVDFLRQRSRPYLFSNARAAADRAWRR